MSGAERRELIARLTPRGGVLVDVGADHGHVAHAVGAIAAERLPVRRGRRDVPWVVSDGLTAFRRVDTAIVTGMGALLIHRILAAGPTPSVAVVHAPDDPPRLRALLAADGWRIDAEGLAPEAGRYAEVLRVVRGQEDATCLELHFGPRLLTGDDPLLCAHLDQLIGHHERLLLKVPVAHTDRRALLQARLDFLRERRATRFG